MQKLQISDIRLDPSTQVRLKTDNEVVTDYAEAMERGDQFPPVVVFFDGEVYWLADLSPEERAVVDVYEGRESYDLMMKDRDYYLANESGFAMLGAGPETQN